MFHFIHKWQIDNAHTTKMATFLNGVKQGDYTELSYTLKCVKCGRVKALSEDISSESLALYRLKELYSLYPNPNLKFAKEI